MKRIGIIGKLGILGIMWNKSNEISTTSQKVKTKKIKNTSKNK